MAAGGVRGAIEAQYEGLSARDRRVLAIGIVFFSAVFVGGLLMFVRGTLNEKAEAIQLQKEKLAEIEGLKVDWAEAEAVIRSGEERIGKFQGQSVSAFLEKVAGDLGMNDELQVSKQQTESEGAVTRTGYRVQLRRTSLADLNKFLYQIETSGYPLLLETTTIRTLRVGEEKQLTVTIEAVHLQLKEAP